MRNILIALVASLGVVSCSEPTADTSSEAAFERSLERMRSGLDASELERFNAAVSQLMLAGTLGDSEGNGFEVLARLAAASEEPERLLQDAAPLIDGKTAHEIMVEADRRTLARLERQAAALEETITGVEAELSEAVEENAVEAARLAEAQMVLDQIEIDRARYHWRESGYLERAIISFRITNNSAVAVKRIFVDGVLETPGRSIPWVDSNFNYEFPGGLEPGEQQSLDLEPNMFGDWTNRSLQNQSDLVLTLSLMDIEGADGERLVGHQSSGLYDDLTPAQRRAENINRLENQLEVHRRQANELSQRIVELRNLIPLAE